MWPLPAILDACNQRKAAYPHEAETSSLSDNDDDDTYDDGISDEDTPIRPVSILHVKLLNQ